MLIFWNLANTNLLNYNPISMLDYVGKVVILYGPTASGKTSLAVELAERINGEVISADSQQIYKELFIGTARPTPDEMDGIPHHLIGHISVKEHYNVSKFLAEADVLIKEILDRGSIPIVCGGSYMWIQSLIDGFSPTPPADEVIRGKLFERVENEGLKKLHDELKKVDKASADKISENDTKRIVRSLEIYQITGKPRSEIFETKYRLPYEYINLAITRPRDILYGRINKRVDLMVEMGFLDEVKKLKDDGLEFDVRRVMAHGYPSVLEHLCGNWTLEEALDNMKMVTRRYAKRQLSFLRGRNDFHVFDSPKIEDLSDLFGF